MKRLFAMAATLSMLVGEVGTAGRPVAVCDLTGRAASRCCKYR